jgi:hypothetical protein
MTKTFEAEIPQVSLRDQIPKKLLKKVKEMELGQQLADIWTLGNSNRADRLDIQAKLIKEFEEFISPIYQGAYAWSSTVHLPVAYTICRSFHSRMMSALLNFDPFFTVTARTEASSDRAPLIQELMRYAVNQWANNNNGINESLDRWIWAWVTTGQGILKVRWDKQYTRILDIQEVQKPGPNVHQVDEQGNPIVIPTVKTVEEEVERVIPVFNGPAVEHVLQEDLLITGGDGDPDKADVVMQQSYMTASELWSLVDQGIFDEEAVKAVIESGEQGKSQDVTGVIKQERTEIGQVGSLDVSYDADRYQILECYVKKDVDGSGIASDIVVWFHSKTREILRATYLHRVQQSGKRPFAVIEFHRRTATDNAVGLVELTYSLTKELDSIHNMRMDFGLLTTLPFGYYKANSSLAASKIPLEPGSLMPLDSPQTDIFFPNLGNRTSFGMQEEASLYNYIERMSAISDLSLGILGNQGASRTATGSRIVANENNTNLDVYLKRMNRGVKKLLHLLYEQIVKNIDPGMQFRLQGDDGESFFFIPKSKEEIAGLYDFELEGSSSASNKQVQIDTAQQLYQATQNPLDIQLGLISPTERFEAVKVYLQSLGIKNWSKFLRKPEGAPHKFTPEEIANRTLAGIQVRLDPTQDLEGFIEYVQHIVDHDELLGQFNEQQTITLVQKQREAAQMLQALKQAAAQQAAAQQMNNNAQMSQQQTNTGMAQPGIG